MEKTIMNNEAINISTFMHMQLYADDSLMRERQKVIWGGEKDKWFLAGFDETRYWLIVQNNSSILHDGIGQTSIMEKF